MILTQEELNAPIPGAPNFTLAELIRSNTATQRGINNTPTDPEIITNLQTLAREALQPCRNTLGPVVVNSGLRLPILNTAIGGSSTSWHCFGKAADIKVPSRSLWDVFCWFYDNVKCVELIAEELPYGWIHVAYSSDYAGPSNTKYKLGGGPVKKASFDDIKKIFKQQGLI